MNEMLKDILSIGVGPLVSLVILWITIRNQNKSQKESLTLLKDQFEKTLEQKENTDSIFLKSKHKMDLISIMPYFRLEGEAQIKEKEKYLRFRLVLKNIGNGIALNVKVVHKSKIIEKLGVTVPQSVVAETSPESVIENNYIYSDVLSNNVIQKGEKTDFEIVLDTEDIYDYGELGVADQVFFYIQFQDLWLNEYTQKFYFDYGTKISGMKVNRVESFEPMLLNPEDL
ncbi:hypothetical protein [Enterocloster lavalensis]|uniref:Uncharacterized protein n=1 Tax=Enterocloster lavalensis TaxID=460384 RepID=A0A1I0GWD2_9FIRM|nr:hypothetical protein [Enterocloster lavalensis]PST30538.1 hypothetical protein C7256_25060 [Enterocloster lavalensis]SET75682.1 hypothetical protein SAMN05216313_11395 [Enterocloster lavalensis]